MRRRFTLGLIALALVATPAARRGDGDEDCGADDPGYGTGEDRQPRRPRGADAHGSGPVKVVAVVNGEGSSPQETQDLMNAMRWVQEHDRDLEPRSPSTATTPSSSPTAWGRWAATRRRSSAASGCASTAVRGAACQYADLTITVPKGARLKVVESVGGIRGSNLDGNLYLDTGSGNIKVDGAAGELVADTGWVTSSCTRSPATPRPTPARAT